MSVTVDFIFDFSGPNAYLAHKVLQPIQDRTKAEFRYIPVLLGGLFKGTNNLPPMQRYADSPAKLAYETLEFSRFIKTYKIPFKMNPHFPVNTVTAIRGLILVQQDYPDHSMAYINAVSDAAWVHEQKLNDPKILAAIIDSIGLDGADLVAGTEDPAIKQRLRENTDAALARGAFGVPTFYVGSEMYFGKERLAQLESEIIAQSS